MKKQTSAIIGQIVGLHGWIDPLFIPMILAGHLSLERLQRRVVSRPPGLQSYG